ncbi:MAG: carboxymuconolactone decarboxylase family protein [Novosphingobium sp.]|nr:carboxymuconolactone decarboxylase family protein [Novosphingobium sp.]
MADPVIPFVDPDQLAPEARAMLDRMADMVGFVPHSMLTYFHRPAIAGAVMGMMGAVFQDEGSTLPAAIKGKIGVICSAINGCAYCTSHQCYSAAHPPGGASGLSDEQLTALVSGTDIGGDPVEAACFSYARAASFDPASVTPDVLEGLKQVLTSAQIVELAALVGLWKMINTIHDTLNLPIEDSMKDYARFLDAAAG